MKLNLKRSLQIAVIVLGLSHPLSAIILRHDRDDSRYRKLAQAYPEFVQMNTQKPGNPADGGGALVGASWVATAAHIAELIRPGHKVTVAGADYPVKAVHIHPDWDDGPNDISLVQLEREVEGVKPAAIHRGRGEAGKLVTIVGIGDTGTGLTGPTGNDGRVRAATNRIDQASEFWLKFKFDQTDAATDLEGISGPGDSGGPAFLDSNGDHHLVGVSSGQSTAATGGREGVYGVTEYYTRVSSYAAWMDSIMTPKSPVSH